MIELEVIPSKVFDWDDRTAFHAAISENSNRRDFSALEELDNTLRLLEIQLGYSTEEVVSLLYRMNNAAKGTTNQNVLVSHEAELVKQIFDSFGRITWQSFVATRLPLLKKPQEILDGIRQGKIHYTKGILLASLKDTKTRQQMLTDVVKNALSLSEIKQRLKALSQSKPSEPATLQQRLTQTIQLAKKDKTLWSNPDKTQQLEHLLSQLEAMITY
jgi:ParB family chromosome partitioning protein